MKEIEKWLTEHRIEWKHAAWGNPYYFNDNFFVSGLFVTFDPSLDSKALCKMTEFERYMNRKKIYTCKRYKYGYRILTTIDATQLEEHETRVSKAVEAFWQAEHARRREKAI